MATILEKRDYITSTYFENEAYILNDWHSGDLTEEDFLEVMIAVADKAQDLKAKSILVDTLKFDFAMSEDLQAQYDREVVPKHVAAGIVHMAFVLPADFIAQMGIEQTMEESNAESDQEARFFDNRAEAEEWVKSL